MASLAAPAREPRRALVDAKPARRPRPGPRPRRAKSRPFVAGGVAWIVLVAVLLAGIVALNVAALQLNMEVDRLEREQDRLTVRHDALVADLSAATAAGRIERQATRRLGLVQPDSTAYLSLKPEK